MASGMVGMLVLRMHDLRVDVNVIAVVVNSVLAVELFVLPAELRIDEPSDQRPQETNQDAVDDHEEGELDQHVCGVGQDRHVLGKDSAGGLVFGLGDQQGGTQSWKHENDSHRLENHCQFAVR